MKPKNKLETTITNCTIMKTGSLATLFSYQKCQVFLISSRNSSVLKIRCDRIGLIKLNKKYNFIDSSLED